MRNIIINSTKTGIDCVTAITMPNPYSILSCAVGLGDIGIKTISKLIKKSKSEIIIPYKRHQYRYRNYKHKFKTESNALKQIREMMKRRSQKETEIPSPNCAGV